MAAPTRTRARRPARLVATLLAGPAALVALAACGGDGSGSIDSRGDQAGGSATTADGSGNGAEDGAATTTTADGGTGVTTVTTDDAVECAPGEEVVVTGSDLDVDLSGSCGPVLVDGVGLRVTIADAGALTVAGTGNQVDVTGTTDGVSVSGTGHQVSAAGDPPVDDTSTGSRVG
jgi:DUF3060 family protein